MCGMKIPRVSEIINALTILSIPASFGAIYVADKLWRPQDQLYFDLNPEAIA